MSSISEFKLFEGSKIQIITNSQTTVGDILGVVGKMYNLPDDNLVMENGMYNRFTLLNTVPKSSYKPLEINLTVVPPKKKTVAGDCNVRIDVGGISSF